MQLQMLSCMSAMIPWLLLVGLLCPTLAREVQTPLGKVLGRDYGDFLAFKGIPYAEQPGRFEAPRAKLPWTGTLNGTAFRSSCIHGFSHHDEDPSESYEESENCLFANVWVPKAFQEPLPVVVFIHGGGFLRNSGSDPNFWGDRFVTNPSNPAILVTFNYRLGVFGFFSWNGTVANVGFRDQQLLLKWVHQNIEAFGGNPQKVLLMGQSAGAMSVMCHLAAPGSAGLFQSAMANSPVGLYYRNREENTKFVQLVAEAMLCTGNITSCLQDRPAKALRDVDVVPEYLRHFTAPCPECANVLAWLPIIDSETLPMNPLVAIERGLHNRVPTIISTVTNETLAFVPTLLMRMGNNRLSYEKVLAVLFDDRALKIQDHYARSPDTSRMSWAERAGVVTTDALMTCYARYAAQALSLFGQAYLSTFMVQPHSSQMHKDKICIQGPPDGATCHASDIAYQIPASKRMSLRTQVGYVNDKELNFSTLYAASIIDFASGRSLFVPYNSSGVSTYWNLEGSGRIQYYHYDHCNFWEEIGYTDVWKSHKSPLPLSIMI
ncbi:unnamed protein product [Durusdinium trenchii]|uniref:Carboxylic ester hydrolase n=1 Tax=Durusdinium trenchii TaxID=1381693 RepID=A0ABP0T090_9DINO